MKRCPITYEPIADNEHYSKQGLRLLAPQLKDLQPLALSAAEQRQEAIARAGKMSIQGVQTKLSAQLSVKENRFDIVDRYGRYILKTPSVYYPELPENEAITMTLATTIGLDVPLHGLIYAKDNSMTYFIKRFDRQGHAERLALEDFAQLLELDRNTKYESTMEKVAHVVSKFCTFPKIEQVKLLKLTLFNYLIGNEDMHLKNFSLLTKRHKISLSPVYDLLNSTIAQQGASEELALSLHGKKKNLKANDFFNYYAKQCLQLNDVVIQGVKDELQAMQPRWEQLLHESFLSKTMQKHYLSLLHERTKKIDI